MEGGFGDVKRDSHFGNLCALLANINTNPKKRSAPYRMQDFWLRPGKNRQQEADNTNKIMAAFDMLAGSESREHGKSN